MHTDFRPPTWLAIVVARLAIKGIEQSLVLREFRATMRYLAGSRNREWRLLVLNGFTVTRPSGTQLAVFSGKSVKQTP